MRIAVLALSVLSAGYLLGYAHASRKGREQTLRCVDLLDRSVKTYASVDPVCRAFVVDPYHRAPQVTP